jgi:DNA-binding transcriptional LysR family regulator
MIDYRLLTFATLARLKHYTKTAEYLSLTQPAVTQHIQYLESYYGVQLVERGRRQISLTPEGKLLLDYAKKVYALSNGIKRALQNQTSINKKYSIGATLTIGEYSLPQILGRHKQANPNIDISMSVQNTDDILKKLDNEEIDLGLIEGPFDKSKYEYRLFKKDELVLAVSPVHRLAEQATVYLEHLLHERLILREEGSGTRAVFEHALLGRGYSFKDFDLFMEIGSLNAIKTLVLANLGVTVISQEAVEREAELGTLCAIPISGIDLQRECYFVYLANHLYDDFIDNFVAFCMGESD